MNPTDFHKFVGDVAQFGALIKELTDQEMKELIVLRLKYGSDHTGFFQYISKYNGEVKEALYSKFTDIYMLLYRCSSLGHKELMQAFELDLAHASIRLKVNEIFEDYPELDQQDYADMLVMTPAEFKDIIQQRKLARDQELLKRADRDEEGNIIYY